MSECVYRRHLSYFHDYNNPSRLWYLSTLHMSLTPLQQSSVLGENRFSWYCIYLFP